MDISEGLKTQDGKYYQLNKCLVAAGASKHYLDPYWGTEMGSCLLTYKIYLTCDFWRKSVDTNFLSHKPPKLIRQCPRYQAELLLWLKAFAMLERMHSLGAIEHPMQIFSQLITEAGGLLLSNFFDDSSGTTSGTLKFVERLQSQNIAMKSIDATSRKNPFNISTHPTSYNVIKQAMKLGDQSDQFRIQFFLPMVSARTRLSQSFRQTGSDSYRLESNGKLKPVMRKGRPIPKK